MKKIISFLCTVISLELLSLPSMNHPIVIEPMDFTNINEKQEKSIDHYTCSEFVLKSLAHGFESRESYEDLQQSRWRIRERLSFLLPSFSFKSALEIPQHNLMEIASSFVGFIFPSHWYKWKESKLLAKAEKQSYKTLLANRISNSQNLFFQIHLFKTKLLIIDHYINQVDKIIDKIITQKKTGIRSVDTEVIGVLFTIKTRLSYQYEDIRRNVSISMSELAFTMGKKMSYSLSLEIRSLTSLMSKESQEPYKTPDRVQIESPEIKAIIYLIEASKKNKKNIYFDFVSPTAKNPLGFGTSSSIRIAKSKIKKLEIQLEKIKLDLQRMWFESATYYNSSIVQYKNIITNRISIDGLTQALMENISNANVDFDLEKVLRFFDYSLSADLRLSEIVHTYWIAEANMDRLYLDKFPYTIIENFIPNQNLKDYK